MDVHAGKHEDEAPAELPRSTGLTGPLASPLPPPACLRFSQPIAPVVCSVVCSARPTQNCACPCTFSPVRASSHAPLPPLPVAFVRKCWLMKEELTATATLRAHGRCRTWTCPCRRPMPIARVHRGTKVTMVCESCRSFRREEMREGNRDLCPMGP